MTAWAAKRFWTHVDVGEVPGGFTVTLDGRAVKTPAKAALVLPTKAMAQAIAAEWAAQTGLIKPDTMPFARYAHSAIDKVAGQFGAVVDIVAAYGGSDLLCYRALAPADLVARQAAGWDPLLDWLQAETGARLAVTAGVMPVAQEAGALETLRGAVAGLDPFQLAAFHDLVAISGSLCLGLAVARGRVSADAGFDLSRIDEHHQAEIWGRDDEAAATESAKRRDFALAAEFFRYCG